MKRCDGRVPNAVRQLHLVPNTLGNSYSSVSVEVGGTRVICAVRLPQQLVSEYRGTRGRFTCVVHRSEFASASSGPTPPISVERDVALALEGVVEQVLILEKVPQLLLEATVEIISDDGALWDAVSTALCVALATSGLDLYDMFSASTAALLPDGTVVLDPTAAEESSAVAVATVCASLTSGELHYMHHRGTGEVATVLELLGAASQAALSRRADIYGQLV